MLKNEDLAEKQTKDRILRMENMESDTDEIYY